MKESRLITLLNTFSHIDWKQFMEFAQSKYNADSDYYKLVKYLKKQNDLIDVRLRDADYLHQKIKSKLDARSFKNVISKLCTYIEDYMIWAEIESNQIEKNIYKLKVFAKRGLSKRYNKLSEDIANTNTETSLWGTFLNFIQNHYSYHYDMFVSKDSGYTEFKNAYDALEDFTVEMRYFYSIEMKNRQRVLNEDWSQYVNPIENLNKKTSDINGVIKLITEMTILRNQDSFEQLYSQFMAPNNWSLEVKNTVMIHLLSYLNHLTKKGQLQYTEKLLNLYIFGIESRILFPNSRIPTRRFFNILNVACGGRRPELALSFIEKYYTSVKNSKPEEVYILALAQIDFYNKDYRKVAIALNKIRFKDFDMEFKARWLKLCCQYEEEKNNHAFLEGEIQTFKNFVKRNQTKLDSSTVLGANALVRMIKLLMKKVDQKSAIQKMKAEQYIVSREWISQKIHEDLK